MDAAKINERALEILVRELVTSGWRPQGNDPSSAAIIADFRERAERELIIALPPWERLRALVEAGLTKATQDRRNADSRADCAGDTVRRNAMNAYENAAGKMNAFSVVLAWMDGIKQEENKALRRHVRGGTVNESDGPPVRPLVDKPHY
jgi:hypothetical protein